MNSTFILIVLLVVMAGVIWGAVRLRDRFEILGEFIDFLRERKLWWILPILIVFALAGLFVVFTTGSPLGYAIYTLF
jgi:heme/copper-type cytochrome/quinol oxidase subunit 2